MLTPKEVLENPDSFMTTLMAVMFNEYDTEFIDWDPLTINLTIQRDFKITPPQENKDKIMAGIQIVSSVDFYQEFNVFAVTCGVVAMSGYSTDMLIPPDLDDVTWTCLEAKLLDDDFKDSLFSDDIKRYVGLLLDEEGLYDPPSVLSFAVYPEGRGVSQDILQDDQIMEKTLISIQQEKKQDYSRILRERTVALFNDLAELDIPDKNTTYIKKALTRLNS